LGAWLITIANYWFGTKVGTELNLDWFFLNYRIASLFMPTLTGIMQIDGLMLKKLYGYTFYMLGFYSIPQVATPETFIYIMLLAMCFICLL
jgi:NHS family xanthosine MFS transporter